MNLSETLIHVWQQFHFIRPYWLLLLMAAIFFPVLLLRCEKNHNSWRKYIDPALLTPLLSGQINAPGGKIPIFASLFWILCAFALAGPTWEKLPQPVEKRDNALVILMDLSPSMLAEDVKPSRLIVARHKILDLLQLRKEGNTALICYSGDAHLVSPLTDDSKTIANLLNALEPGIMPVYGSNVEHALTLAIDLLQRSGYSHGDILLVTDGITVQALNQSASLLNGKPYTLSIIGVGTEEGGPIPTGTNSGGFAKDSQGKIILPQLHAELLSALAKKVNGYYSPLQLNDNDIQPLITGTQLFNDQNTKKTDREFDQWRDVGSLLCLLLLPIIFIAFRRGLIISIILTLSLIHTPGAHAQETSTSSWYFPSWDEMWLNSDQRAMKAMQNKDYKNAAKDFKDHDWKASAQYANGDYASALEQFKKGNTAKDYYNRGNALAKSGQLEGAVSAYKEALKKDPQNEDAAFNKKIVDDLLKNQKKESPQQNQNNDKSDKSQDQQRDQQEQDKNQQDKDNPSNNQKDKNAGNQDENSGQHKNDNASPDKNTGQNSADQQKAHEETDKNKDAKDAQARQQDTKQKQPNENSQQNNNGEPQDADDKLSAEQKQALDQWLRQVPDDPSGLLRNKFEYYYQQHLQEQRNGKSDEHMNNEERW